MGDGQVAIKVADFRPSGLTTAAAPSGADVVTRYGYDFADRLAFVDIGGTEGDQTRRFLEGYSARSPWRLKPAAVLWYTAAVLVHKQARKYVVHLHEDREEKVDRVLRLAEGALAACEHLQPGTSLDVVDVVSGVLC